MVRVCFVCLGNICRSPTAEAAFRELVEQAGLEAAVHIESAGTGDWHVGHERDARAIEAGRRRGLVLTGRARQFQASDFDRFDYVVAMDAKNVADLAASAPGGASDPRVVLFRSFDPAAPAGAEVPDPYFTLGFDEVIDQCRAAAAGLLCHLRERHGLAG